MNSYQELIKFIQNHLIIEDLGQRIIYQEFKDAEYTEERFQGLKRFKRILENQYKLNQSDVAAMFWKLKVNNHSICEIIKDLSFDGEKINHFNKENLANYNFNHLLYTNQELIQITNQIFHQVNALQHLNIKEDQLNRLMIEINKNYNIVPYHNYTHAFALFQMMYSCYVNSELSSFVEETDIVSALMASLAHDLNHKGVNNLYKLKKSKKFNRNIYEQAILENMHAATFFNILSFNQQLDFLSQLPIQQSIQIRKIIISSILATDMGQHFPLYELFKSRTEATLQVDKNDELTKFRVLDRNNFDDRNTILRVMVHASDISNPCLKWDQYINWSKILTQEFNDQTLKEKQKEIEVTAFLQYKDKLQFYNGQTFFIKTFVQPLWDTIALLCPKLQILTKEILANLDKLEQEKKQFQ